MVRKKVILASILAFVVGFCPFVFYPRGADADGKMVLKYAHVGTTGEIQTRWAAEFASLVNKRTKGRIEIQVFPNGQLGNIDEMMDGVQSGAISMAHHAFSSLARYVPAFSVLSAPYIYKSPEQAIHAGNPGTSPVLREFNKQLIKKANMRVIGSFYMGARELSCKFPVHSPADLKGVKIRSVPFKLWDSMIRGMGAIPTPVEVSELSTALMTGLVAGEENPLDTIYARKWYESQPYIMMTNHMLLTLCVFVNERVWRSIPQRDKKIINEVMAEMAQKSVEWNKKVEKATMVKLKKKGVTFITEKNGLKVNAFKAGVMAQLKKDFPDWSGYIKRLEKVK